MKVTLLDVIDRLYDAVCDLPKWLPFLEAAADLFDSQGAQIGHNDLVNRRLSFSQLSGYSWPPEIMRRYETLMHEDPRLPYFAANPFRPVHCRMSIGDAELHASRVYREVLSVCEVEYSLGVNLVEDATSLTYFLVLRNRRQPRFTQAECDLMGELIPHLNRALRLQREVGMIDFQRRAAIDVLDTMAMGIVVMEGNGHIRFANATAREIAARDDGIRILADRLSVASEGEPLRARARRLIDAAREGIDLPGEAFRVTRRSGAEPYALLVSALWGNRLRYGWTQASEPLAIVYLRDPDRPVEHKAEVLQRIYGLTPRQAQLAERLAEGHSLRTAAGLLDLTEASARQYLKLIHQKAGTHSQAELVRKVLLAPAQYARNDILP